MVTAGGDGGPARFDCALQRLLDGRVLLAQLHAVTGDVTDIEQVIDQTHHLGDLPLHDPARGAQSRVRQLGPLEQPQTVTQGRQRIAQLVCEHGEKLVLAPVRCPQLLLCPFSFSDVQVDAGEADRFALLVVVITTEGADPGDIVFAAHDAVLDCEVGALPDCVVEGLADDSFIVRMQARPPHLRRDAAVRCGLESEQLEGAAIPERLAGTQVAVPEGHARSVDDELQSRLALTQSLLSALAQLVAAEVGVETQHEDEDCSSRACGNRMDRRRKPVARRSCRDSHEHARQVATPSLRSGRVHAVTDRRFLG